MPWCDTPAMAAHLAEISAAVDPGAHAVLMLDQAGWHMTAKLAVPHNITLLPLPPRFPELNPVENVWQFMRDNWLSNRVFKSYDDIVALCCDAWNNLTDRPWKIIPSGCGNGPMGDDQRRLVSAGAEPRRGRVHPGLEAVDESAFSQRQADIVEPVQQAALAERIDSNAIGRRRGR